jgi:hypothetical protein
MTAPEESQSLHARRRAELVGDMLAVALEHTAKRLAPHSLAYAEMDKWASVIGAMVIAQALLQASEDAR